MKRHICRSWPQFFTNIEAGLKTHDLRKNDRDYQVGDEILLQEYDNIVGRYTGRECLVDITYITDRNYPCAFSSAVLPPDYCILSIQKKHSQP